MANIPLGIQVKELTASLAAMQEEHEGASAKIEAFDGEKAELEGQIEALKAEKETFESEKATFESDKAEAEKLKVELDKKLEVAQSEIDEAKAEVKTLEVALKTNGGKSGKQSEGTPEANAKDESKLTRADFDKLNSYAKSAFMRDGGKLI